MGPVLGFNCNKTDCFSNIKRRCTLLTEPCPRKDGCPFYKTAQEFKKDINKHGWPNMPDQHRFLILGGERE